MQKLQLNRILKPQRCRYKGQVDNDDLDLTWRIVGLVVSTVISTRTLTGATTI